MYKPESVAAGDGHDMPKMNVKGEMVLTGASILLLVIELVSLKLFQRRKDRG